MSVYFREKVAYLLIVMAIIALIGLCVSLERNGLRLNVGGEDLAPVAFILTFSISAVILSCSAVFGKMIAEIESLKKKLKQREDNFDNLSTQKANLSDEVDAREEHIEYLRKLLRIIMRSIGKDKPLNTAARVATEINAAWDFAIVDAYVQSGGKLLISALSQLPLGPKETVEDQENLLENLLLDGCQAKHSHSDARSLNCPRPDCRAWAERFKFGLVYAALRDVPRATTQGSPR